jgi:DNA-binding IclR family transcriptional regulator
VPGGTSAPGDLDALRAEIRRNGIARNSGDTRRDALAAPVFNYEGKLVMVLTIVADAKSMNMDLDGDAGRKLRETAEGLSRQLGARIGQARTSSAA